MKPTLVALLLLASSGAPPFLMFNAKSSLVAFVRPEAPSHSIGYRIVEGEPILTAVPVEGYEALPERRKGHPAPPALDPSAAAYPDALIPRSERTAIWKAFYDDGYQDKRFRFHFGADGVAHFRYSDDEHGSRVTVLKAVEDGIEAWMWLEPRREVTGAFVVQQCLRYSGAGNTPKRRESAFVPHLSEYDLWEKGDMRSLSLVRAGQSWKRIDPVADFAAQSEFKRAWEYISRRKGRPALFLTPQGVRLWRASGGDEPARGEVPHGLVVRESADGRTISGMYWERSAAVSVHHPADCLHSFVDLGPASPGKPRVVRGKIYALSGTKDDLLARWKRDFPD